jgi:hypothetical protein
VHGPKFWDVRMDRGGGGAIDLVMHIHGLNFKAAAKLLKERVYEACDGYCGLSRLKADRLRASHCFSANDGWPLEPAQSFLWHALVTHGSIESKLTWEAYGRRLYDYFAFLSANDLAWNETKSRTGSALWQGIVTGRLAS